MIYRQMYAQKKSDIRHTCMLHTIIRKTEMINVLKCYHYPLVICIFNSSFKYFNMISLIYLAVKKFIDVRNANKFIKIVQGNTEDIK